MAFMDLIILIAMLTSPVLGGTLSRSKSPWLHEDEELSFGYRRCSPYEGFLPPDDWNETYPNCQYQDPDKYVQSPININTSAVTGMCLYKVFFTHDDYYKGTFENNGHSAVFTIDGTPLVIKGVPLNMPEDCKRQLQGNRYIFKELHFHIGAEWLDPTTEQYLKSDENCSDHVEVKSLRNIFPGGSEHSVNDKFYNGEIHLTFYKKGEKDLETARHKFQGVTVLTIFFNVKEHNINDDVETAISTYVSQIKKVGTKVSAQINPPKFFPGSDFAYTYTGTETAPPCGHVQYVMFKDPINITPSAYKLLQQLETHERPLHRGWRFRGFTYTQESATLQSYGNRRPIQNEGTPEVYANFEVRRPRTRARG